MKTTSKTKLSPVLPLRNPSGAILLSGLCGALLWSAASASADTITKTNNLDALNLASSWITNGPPTSADIATWNSSSAGGSVSLGASQSWSGIFISSGAPSSVTITDPGSTTLTLGVDGISLNSVTNASNRGITIAPAIVLAADQTWGLGSQSSANITASAVISGNYALSTLSAQGNLGVLNLNAANTFTGGFTNGADAIVSYSSGLAPSASSGTLNSSPFGTGPLTINGGTITAGSKSFFNPSVSINGDFTWSTSGRDDTSGYFDLGGGTRTITLTRGMTAAQVITGGGNNAIRFTTFAGDLGFTMFTNGSLRLAAAASVTAGNYVQPTFQNTNYFANNAGLIVGAQVYCNPSFSSNPFGSISANYPALTVEAGGYFSLGDGGAVKGPSISSLAGNGEVATISSAASGTGILTIDGGTGTSSAEFTGVIRDNDPTAFPTSSGTLILALTKKGSTTQILSGTNTYSGLTTVSAGTLETSTLSSNGIFTVSSSAKLGVKVAAAGTSLQIKGLTNSTSTLFVDLNGLGRPTVPVIVNSGNNTANGNVTVNVLGKTGLTTGSFDVITNASATRGTAKYVLGSVPAGVVATLTDNTNVVTINISAVNPITDFLWTGANGSAWDIGATTNWINDANPAGTAYNETPPRAALFDDTAVAANVNITTTVQPTSVVFNNSSKTYNLTGSGKISGSAGITLASAGTVTMDVANDYTGQTLVQAASGNLVISNSLALGNSSDVVLSNNANLRLDNNITVAGRHLSLGSSSGLGSLASATGTSNNWTGNITLTQGNARFNTHNTTELGILNVSGVIDSAGIFYNEAINVRYGTVYFSGASTYVGNTVVANGTAVLAGGNDRLPVTTILNLGFGTANAGTFDLNGQSQTLAGLQLYGVNNGSTSSTVQNSAGTLSTLTINADTNATTYGGVLTGNIALVKTGTNSFTLGATASDSRAGSTTVNQGILLVDGSVSSSAVTVNSGGTLGGAGSIGGSVTVSGNLAPGDGGIGTLSLSSLSLSSGSQTEVDVDSDNGTSDLVGGLSSVSYAGTLVVNNLGAATVTNGQSFTLFSTSGTGNFSSISPSSPAAGLNWSFSPSSGVLTAVTVSGGSAVLTNSFSGGKLTLSWPSGWSLQMQTNTLAKGLSTNWTDIPSNSPAVITPDPTKGAVFYRLKQ